MRLHKWSITAEHGRSANRQHGRIRVQSISDCRNFLQDSYHIRGIEAEESSGNRRDVSGESSRRAVSVNDYSTELFVGFNGPHLKVSQPTLGALAPPT